MEGYTVLYICDYAAKYTGSFIPSLLALKQKLQEKNDVRFLFPETARGIPWISLLSEDPEKISFCVFSPEMLRQECRRLRKELKDRKVIVHTHFVGDFNLLAVKSCFPKLFCHYHMMVPGDGTFAKKCKRTVRRLIYRDIVIVGVSQAVQEDAARYFPGAKAECVPNAVDFSRLETCKAEPVKLGKAVGSQQFSVLVHASDFVCKGVDVALRAMEELNEAHNGAFRLYMTSNHPEDTLALVKPLVNSMDHITIVPSVENIGSLYDCMDLYISPSREEAFGYAVVEAAYCGCQVAASNIPGQNTMKCVPGILWMGKDDVPGLKEVILTAVDRQKQGLAPQIKEQQRRFVRETFDMGQWAMRNIALYEKYAN